MVHRLKSLVLAATGWLPLTRYDFIERIESVFECERFWWPCEQWACDLIRYRWNLLALAGGSDSNTEFGANSPTRTITRTIVLLTSQVFHLKWPRPMSHQMGRLSCLSRLHTRRLLLPSRHRRLSMPKMKTLRAPQAEPPVAQPAPHEILASLDVLREQINVGLAALDSTIALNAESGPSGPSTVHDDASEQRVEAPPNWQRSTILHCIGLIVQLAIEITFSHKYYVYSSKWLIKFIYL